MADTATDEYWGRNAYGGYGDARDPTKRSGMSDEANDYRNRGNEAGARPAFQADYSGYKGAMGDAGADRGTQGTALNLIGSRARGEQPSAAEIAGRSAMEQSLQSQIAAAGSARGGPQGTASALRNAAATGAVQRQQMTQGIQAGRAGEIAQAQDQYFGGASTMRGQDYQGAGVELGKTAQDIQNEQAQRALDAQQQLAYEQMRQKVFEDQLAANQNAQSESDQAWNAGRGSKMQDEAAGFDKFLKIGGAVAGAATGGIGAGVAASDERVKFDIIPMGGPPGGSDPTGAYVMRGGGMDVMGTLKKMSAIETGNGHGAGFGRMGDPEGGESRPTTYSDEDTKEPAWTSPKDFGMRTAKDEAKVPTAPGTDDFERYGGATKAKDGDGGGRVGSAKTEGEPDWSRGGTTKKPEGSSKFNSGSMLLGLSSSLLGGAFAPRAPTQTGTTFRDITKSDARAKEAAYQSGVEHGVSLATGPDTDTDTEAMRQRKLASNQRKADIAGTIATAPLGGLASPALAGREAQAAKGAGGMVARAIDATGVRQVPSALASVGGRIRNKANALIDGSTNAAASAAGARGGPPTAMGEPLPEERDVTESDERAKDVMKQTEPLAEAARSQDASAYRYKSPYTPPGQEPGEVNVGPIAQNMEADPVASTTIVKDKDGMLGIDKEKLLKLMAGEIAAQQHQIDALASAKKRAA